MAGTARPIARGTLDLLALQQRRERQAQRKATARQQTPTHPIYNPDFPDNSVEGQIAFQGAPRLPWYFADGVWQRFAGVEYVYLSSDGPTTLPDTDTTVAFDFQGGVSGGSGAPALTDTPAVFETAVQSAGAYAGKHGLKINEPGIYLPLLSVIVASEANDATQKVQHLEYNLEGVGGFSASSWMFSGSFDASVYGNQSIAQLWSVEAGGQIIGVGAANDRGTGDVIAQAYLVVVRLGLRTIEYLTGGSTNLF